MRPSLPMLAALTLSFPVVAQGTGRTMRLLAPVVIGQTASFGMTYPPPAAGNLYFFMWCMPPFPGTTTMTVPGFTLTGAIRINPQNSVTAYSGLLGPTGAVSHSLGIPSHPSFLGMSWDLQSVDLQASTSTVFFSDNELPLAIVDQPPPNMVPIVPGTFLMGSNAGPPDYVVPYYSYPGERPVHQVAISRPFWIGKHEVTQSEYQSVMGVNPSYFQGASWPSSATRPVEMVTWNDAMAYCAALTATEAALGRVPAGYQYRLPTEAEWEFCCRAGTTTEFHLGGALLCGQANFSWSDHSLNTCYAGNGSTLGVGTYPPNAWGLHDMHGNVWEWCLDWWDLAAGYPAGPVTDPCVTGGVSPAIRGGGWGSWSRFCRSGSRQNFGLFQEIGFRVVLAPILL